MKLSIIIVNYNVKYFLEQCLLSVQKAIQYLKNQEPSFETEVIVVDNNSVDSSVEMLKSRFPWVQCIFNNENLGYARANNQGLKIARGEYVLLLNPDTVIQENTLFKIISFADSKPDLGGLGVKMLDGSGKFLPESKRGLPTPMAALFKITGLSRLFPKSRFFGRYHLRYLDENQIHEVEILSGAFMLLRKKALEKTGLLDESFFMYGEDIDISYRILKAGFKNYYYPETQIIHYKGESTKKGSLNYVILFYNAMIIFARKHFSPKRAGWFSFLIKTAIVLRASLSVIKRVGQRLFLPFMDALLIFGGLLAVKSWWESNTIIGHGYPYPRELVLYIFPLYTTLWLLGLMLNRNYFLPFRNRNIIRGIITGTILISVAYAFFGESWRFSRALIVLGTFSSLAAAFLTRLIYNKIAFNTFQFGKYKSKRIAIIGSLEEAEKTAELIQKSGVNGQIAGIIYPHQDQIVQSKHYLNLGNLDNLKEIIQIFKINELVFCAKDMPSSEIMSVMAGYSNSDISFKIAPENSLFIIGSHSKNNTGDYYAIEINLAITQPEQKFNKRVFDIFSCMLLWLSSPLLILTRKQIMYFIKESLRVFTGQKTWVGYFSTGKKILPALKPSVLPPVSYQKMKFLNPAEYEKINMIYAREYSVYTDWEICWSWWLHARNLSEISF